MSKHRESGHASLGTVLALLGLAAAANGQSVAPPDASAIQWRSGAVSTKDTISAEQRIVELARAPARHIVVQFDRPVTSVTRAKLFGAGITLLNYLGSNAYFAALSARSIDPDSLTALGTLVHAEAIRAEHRV